MIHWGFLNRIAVCCKAVPGDSLVDMALIDTNHAKLFGVDCPDCIRIISESVKLSDYDEKGNKIGMVQ